ncbi:hypothetical protein [Kribbella solani]|uniref:hypothetical protein n=1 Tax=Kribbella solani TaxID=236067 RepID=UPI0029B3D957|nr:hypothetical protein [Kribbella solani]MDX2967647.1 hypothetical protein [Kribbella solani]
MSYSYRRPSPDGPVTTYRDPSNDVWFRKHLDKLGAEVELLNYEATGRDGTWSAAVMYASASVRAAPEADVFNGLAERLAAEYNTDDNRGNWIDTHDALTNVRSDVTQSYADQSLTWIAVAIVKAEDIMRVHSRPDPAMVGVVRNAMVQRLADSRGGSGPADGPGTYGARLGRDTAEAGIGAIKQVFQEERMARLAEVGLGAQAAPGTAPAATEQNGNTSQKPATGRETKSTDLGGRG